MWSFQTTSVFLERTGLCGAADLLCASDQAVLDDRAYDIRSGWDAGWFLMTDSVSQLPAVYFRSRQRSRKLTTRSLDKGMPQSRAVLAECLQGYRGSMEYLKGPLSLDIAVKGLCLAGVVLMVFAQGGWFIVGVFAVFIGMLIGAWAMVAARRTRSLRGPIRSGTFRRADPEGWRRERRR